MLNSAEYVTNEKKTPAGSSTDARGTAGKAQGPERQAALWRRLAAVAYDSILLAALFFIVSAIAVASHRAAVESGSVWFQLLLAATAWLYFGWCWVHGGQSVAMRAWKLRVVRLDESGMCESVGWGRATLRFVTAWLPALPLLTTLIGVPAACAAAFAGVGFLVGFAAALLNPQRACWHDYLSGTRLIRTD